MENNKNLSGNVGEWSEIYTFLYLLGEGKLYSADEDLNVSPDEPYIPIVRIIREETQSPEISYYTGEYVCIKDGKDHLLTKVESAEFKNQARELYTELVSLKEKSGIRLPQTEQFIRRVYVHTLKAPSKNKSDILMQIRDVNTGVNPVCGWSIKSQIGGSPTLLNASKSTNIVFDVGSTLFATPLDSMMHAARLPFKQRTDYIDRNNGLTFDKMLNPVFDRNLRLIDTTFPKIFAAAALLYSSGKTVRIKETVEQLEAHDPLDIGAGMYEYKFKKFLCSVALGMTPAKEWDGRDDATGGYIVVKRDGEVLGFHIYNRNMFEDYLYKNTRFDTPSTSRHGFGEIYLDDKTGEYKYNINVQIRFDD